MRSGPCETVWVGLLATGGPETLDPDGSPVCLLLCEPLLEKPPLVTLQEVQREGGGLGRRLGGLFDFGRVTSRILMSKHTESVQPLGGEDLEGGSSGAPPPNSR
jgi:hypothetical protein